MPTKEVYFSASKFFNKHSGKMTNDVKPTITLERNDTTEGNDLKDDKI